MGSNGISCTSNASQPFVFGVTFPIQCDKRINISSLGLDLGPLFVELLPITLTSLLVRCPALFGMFLLQLEDHAVLLIAQTVVIWCDVFVDISPLALGYLGSMAGEQLFHARQVLRGTEISVPPAALETKTTLNITLLHLLLPLQVVVVWAAQFFNPSVPVPLLTEELVDDVVQVADGMLAEAGILDLGDAVGYLPHDLTSPLLTIVQMLAEAGQMRPTLRAGVGPAVPLGSAILLHLHPLVHHVLRLLFGTRHG
mmetsp:Transcript_13108/g.37370  ORF Transcript_13108/g.37370 Transcript_13108/m.37370 type:complete len:255 (-) Transcript_13108:143-907(-)